MMTTTSRRPYRPSRYITAEVEVDISDYLAEVGDEELEELGLRRLGPADTNATGADLYSVINALHQQAHPDQPIFADTCLREPCRSMSLRRHPHLSASGQDELL